MLYDVKWGHQVKDQSKHRVSVRTALPRLERSSTDTGCLVWGQALCSWKHLSKDQVAISKGCCRVDPYFRWVTGLYPLTQSPKIPHLAFLTLGGRCVSKHRGHNIQPPGNHLRHQGECQVYPLMEGNRPWKFGCLFWR